MATITLYYREICFVIQRRREKKILVTSDKIITGNIDPLNYTTEISESILDLFG